jgi:hypothetical protein
MTKENAEQSNPCRTQGRESGQAGWNAYVRQQRETAS